MTDDNQPEDTSAGASPEMSDAVRAGLREAGYHVMRAGYELLAGVSAFLEAVGGSGSDDGGPEGVPSEHIEVE